MSGNLYRGGGEDGRWEDLERRGGEGDGGVGDGWLDDREWDGEGEYFDGGPGGSDGDDCAALEDDLRAEDDDRADVDGVVGEDGSASEDLSGAHAADADFTPPRLGAGRTRRTGRAPTGVPNPAGEPSPQDAPPGVAGLPAGRRRLPTLLKPEDARRAAFKPQERLLILDSWLRSGLPAGDFAPLVGLSKHTLYLWKKQFQQHGPAGLMERPRGTATGSKLSEVTKRTILLLKHTHPEWGCQRISDELVRGPALSASPSAVARVLHEAGYTVAESPTRPHPDKVRSFERARPNQLWQTDLFTFVLKRQNRRLHLVAFMDDHSRFLVSYGLHATASTALVLEVLRAAIASYGPPQEVLTDNGPQYVTWRGKSQFSRELERQGIRQVVAKPKRPQTLGKIERFWGTLWRDCLEQAVFVDLEDARRRIGLFIDHYNFQRPHQGIEGLAPADRFFGAASTVLSTLRERVAVNALELARQGLPKQPFYVTGSVAGQPFSVHAEGERVILTRPGQPRQEVDLVRPEELAERASAAPQEGPGSASPQVGRHGASPSASSHHDSPLAVSNAEALGRGVPALGVWPTPVCPQAAPGGELDSGHSGAAEEAQDALPGRSWWDPPLARESMSSTESASTMEPSRREDSASSPDREGGQS